MASEIKVDSIVNSSGDEDSGFDLSTNDVVKVKTADNERMRVDASGNILFNKTALNNTDTGARFNATGDASFVKSGGSCLKLNRTSSHGGIIEILKDNTAVGQLDSSSGNLLIRTNGNKSGIRFDTNGLTAFKNGSEADNTVDLGYSSGRFRDLYLGGGVFVGGTGSANKLDDYEEGTHNPTSGSGVSMSASVGSYSKVGNICVLYFRVVFGSESSSSNAYISLPFTSKSESINAHFASGVPFYTTYSASQIRYGVLQNTSQLYFYDGQTGQISFSDLSTRQVNGSIVYLTA